jgi:hypothetical protein
VFLHPRVPVFWLGSALLVVVGSAGLVVTQRFEERLQEVDAESARRARTYETFHERLELVRADLVTLRTDLQQAVLSEESTREALRARLDSTEHRLGSIGNVIEAQASSLEQLKEAQASFVPELEAEIAARDERLQKRWDSLRELASTASQIAGESQRKVAEISAPRDLQRMWRELVGPVVQVAGEASVGSGVLLGSRPAADGGEGFETYMLTAWHVIRDIQGDASNREEPVSVSVYDEDGAIRHELAQLLDFDVEIDVALLLVRSADDLGRGATLATPQRLGEVRIFDEIYAVGCPLGNDPIPTRGEIATCHHDVEGEIYWMINAPTYIGNSGGGIFDGQTHELLGIFSKIYTHGSLRPTIVPHMGLVIPLSTIYGWLATSGHAELIPQPPLAAPAALGR